jgi:outer membrane protein OmpA-like peptidoglycan-associated protein
VTRNPSQALFPRGGAVGLLLALVLCAAPAAGQVTVDLHALDQLKSGGTSPKAAPKGGGPGQAAPKERPGKPARKSEAARRKPAEAPAAAQAPPAAQAPAATQAPLPLAPPPPALASPVVPSTNAPPVPVLPGGPPPPVRLSPLEAVTPAAKPPPSPEPIVVAGAGGAAAPISEGLRVTFGDGSELNPETETAIKGFAHQAPKTDDASINVLAYAAGTPEDPSTARRLSLSRALAVRSVLIAEGVASTRIYVRALGSASGEGPADRVDLSVVSVMGANTSAVDAGAAK